MNTMLRQGTTIPLADTQSCSPTYRGRLTRALSHSWLIASLAGCSSNGSDGVPGPTIDSSLSPATPAAAAIEPPTGLDGFYRGTATIGDSLFHAEALITADGAMRIYIGGATADGAIASGAGLPEALLDPIEAAQFVGTLESAGASGIAHGVVIGQACTSPAAGRFCGEPVGADADLTRVNRDYPQVWDLDGEVRIEQSAFNETWLLDMTAWSIYYSGPARQELMRGAYEEKLAPFAKPGDATISIDSAGRVFFQSPGSGCVGNGSLAPHPEGSRFVFDVSLLIESCASSHAFLNGHFAGLATSTQDGFWDYDDWLVMFLSTTNRPPASTAAIKTFANRVN
jgi:hypothetical protein